MNNTKRHTRRAQQRITVKIVGRQRYGASGRQLNAATVYTCRRLTPNTSAELLDRAALAARSRHLKTSAKLEVMPLLSLNYRLSAA